MQHVFWLIEGEVAGRCCPASEAWTPAALMSAGIQCIYSLTPLSDEIRAGLSGLQQFNCLLPAVTTPGLLSEPVTAQLTQQLTKIVADIQQCREQNMPVLLHCATGNEWTALVMACYLVSIGAAPVHAVSQVRAVHELAFNRDGWDQFVFDVIYAMQ